MNEVLLRIAVNAPLNEALTYRANRDSPVSRGESVLVPLGQRQAHGVVLGPTDVRGDYELKDVRASVSHRPAIPDSHLQWLEWLAEYYLYPVGQVTALTFPPLETAQRQRRSNKSAAIPKAVLRTPPELTPEQAEVLKNIALDSTFGVHLIHGVTGSGKTEIYLRLLAEVVKTGRQGLVLVPEISLTPQLLERFAARFGDRIAVLHSYLTAREKTEQWWSMVNEQKSILVGTRSALFCPLPKLGLIIVDEEHEPSFKQDESLRYHARDAAIMLAKFRQCPIALGSATPSLESWNQARTGRYKLHRLTKRVAQVPLPLIEIVDLKEMRQKRGDGPSDGLPFWLSPELHAALSQTLARGEQAALFLNRRGVAQAALCQGCGHVVECPNCAISLTVHGHGHLVCHYCDYTQRLPEKCPECKTESIESLGLGTELVERDVASLFPDARLARADRDEVSSREDLEALIRGVENRDIDILIGTQMIAKGLDFPGLNLVGLVLADVGFSLPDFRASERSFQLLTQVAGRSGRHSKEPGRVLIQTYNPDHPAIVCASQHTYEMFAEQELNIRQELAYPPFRRVGLIRLHALHLAKVERAAQLLRERASQLSRRPHYSLVQMLGPAPAPIAKLRRRFRYHALVKAPDAATLRSFSSVLVGDSRWLESGVKAVIDIDPLNMM